MNILIMPQTQKALGIWVSLVPLYREGNDGLGDLRDLRPPSSQGAKLG